MSVGCIELSLAQSTTSNPPEDFPQFIVPGHEKEMESVRKLFWHYYETTVPLIPLWDEYLPMSTLWPAAGEKRKSESMRKAWANALSSRKFNQDGYILTQQHDGTAHSEGWPFPLWIQGGGVGWHFSSTSMGVYDGPIVTTDGWRLNEAVAGSVNKPGWKIDLRSANAYAQSPACLLDAKNFFWMRLNWYVKDLEGSDCYLEWTTKEHPEFSSVRRVYFSPVSADQVATGDSAVPIMRTMIPVYKNAEWKGTITGFRINFGNTAPATVIIKSFHSAFDSRHSVNNINFIRGCHDYFMWTKDISFLRTQITRIRASMRFIEAEFDTRKRKCIYTTWRGHEGRSGIRYVDGKKVIIEGDGIGCNYWDLLPFGGEDALATIYYYDLLKNLATLEEEIKKHPEWAISHFEDYEPADLRKHAEEVRAYGRKRFWNETTQRYGTVDLDGVMHDYGFTFLNNEAVHFDFATKDQEKLIRSWLDGKRIVKGDTSKGADIYYWRFGPRSSTKRNLDYYVWSWFTPEEIAFGDQVQDGGGILAWSYYDLMARIKTEGPDQAIPLLKEILTWFEETQAEGGFRSYYKKGAGRGNLQGGNVAGGIGVDMEFYESILVPQVMLYGFVGFNPTVEGFTIDPNLPSDWPELTITKIHLHDFIFDIKVTKDKNIVLTGTDPADEVLQVKAPEGFKVTKKFTSK